MGLVNELSFHIWNMAQNDGAGVHRLSRTTPDGYVEVMRVGDVEYVKTVGGKKNRVFIHLKLGLYSLVWELIEGAAGAIEGLLPEDIPLDAGGMATFPCLTATISKWVLSQKKPDVHEDLLKRVEGGQIVYPVYYPGTYYGRWYPYTYNYIRSRASKPAGMGEPDDTLDYETVGDGLYTATGIRETMTYGATTKQLYELPAPEWTGRYEYQNDYAGTVYFQQKHHEREDYVRSTGITNWSQELTYESPFGTVGETEWDMLPLDEVISGDPDYRDSVPSGDKVPFKKPTGNAEKSTAILGLYTSKYFAILNYVQWVEGSTVSTTTSWPPPDAGEFKSTVYTCKWWTQTLVQGGYGKCSSTSGVDPATVLAIDADFEDAVKDLHAVYQSTETYYAGIENTHCDTPGGTIITDTDGTTVKPTITTGTITMEIYGSTND
jgi:hypothetical protein